MSSGQSLSNFWMKGDVAPRNFKAPGTEEKLHFDTRGALLANQHGGNYAELVRQGRCYYASAAAFVIPVTGATPTSLFSLYNPAGSNVNLELIETNVVPVNVTTVVDAVGVYWNTPAQTAAAIAANAPTAGVVKNCLLNGSSGQGVFYTSFVLTTPALARIIGGWGAVTANYIGTVFKDFEGTLIVPPGVSAHLLMTTAASQSSTADILWAEIPLS
jgi:hypothetical protein